MHLPSTIDEVQQLVRQESRIRVTGGGTKSALSQGANLSTKNLSGVLEYEPGEFTFTAMAGTPVCEVQKLVAENGQYLPFDPVFAQSGATLGGTVASGLSGSGRFRYGGVRDFLLGVRLVNGAGEVVYGGGKVVKNAAGFDIPKLMVGSLGRFGVLVEMNFKVFPTAAASRTMMFDLRDVDQAVDTLKELATSNEDLDRIDLESPSRLWIRISGIAAALPLREQRIRNRLPDGYTAESLPDDGTIWRAVNEFEWLPDDHGLVKIPLTPDDIPRVEGFFNGLQVPAPRRYSVAGNLAWVGWPPSLDPSQLDALLSEIGRPAVAVRGDWPQMIMGSGEGQAFVDRLLSVFDPDGKFCF